ncbi:MAG: amidohydrolase family protein [Gemmataceae bacterium]
MTDPQLSRRELLGTLGGVLVGQALGQAGRVEAADTSGKAPPVVDTHIHVANPRLPGIRATNPGLAPFGKADVIGLKRLAKAIEEETRKAGITHALCMPRLEISDADPLGIQDTLAVAEAVRGVRLYAIGLAHPERYDRDHLERVEAVLKQGKVKALKAYLGYLHHGPSSPGYRPYYRLAAKYKVPVIFHSGDTYSTKAKLRYAHPLGVDEVAVDYPETRFVLAHFGNPWLMDAAEVLYKNANVYADLSAVLIGDAEAFATMKKEGVLERAVKRVQEAIEFSEAPGKFMFATDWPLAPWATYRDFVRQLFPEKHHAAVFGGTAKTLFNL